MAKFGDYVISDCHEFELAGLHALISIKGYGWFESVLDVLADDGMPDEEVDQLVKDANESMEIFGKLD